MEKSNMECADRLLCSRYTMRCLKAIREKQIARETVYKKDLLTICNLAALNDFIDDAVKSKLIEVEKITDPQIRYILTLTEKGMEVSDTFLALRDIIGDGNPSDNART